MARAQNSSNGSQHDDGSLTIDGLDEAGTALDSSLEGTEEQLSFKTGSEFNLADSTLKIAAIPPLTVRGQYKEGDRIQVVVEVEVEHISFPPIRDRGFRVGTERRHHASPLAAHQAD